MLFEMFQESRQASKSPQDLLNFQYMVCQMLLRFQKMKADREAAGDLEGMEIVKHLILLLKQIMDAVVWRVLDFRRIDAQLLAEHHQTGHLDASTQDDLAEAQAIVNKEEAIVLVNDLTNILRYGDLTIIKGGNSYEV